MVSTPRKNFLRCLSDSTGINYKTFHGEQQLIDEKVVVGNMTTFLEQTQKEMLSKIQKTKIDEEVSENVNSKLSSSDTIIETGLTTHKEMKSGIQRLRWNLIFNVLFWILVPLPFWIPFISNRVAYFVIPSIQCVFVLMWTGKR